MLTMLLENAAQICGGSQPWLGGLRQSQTFESCSRETAIQNVNIKVDPHANMPRGLVFNCESERCLLSQAHSPPSQTILEICVRGWIDSQSNQESFDPQTASYLSGNDYRLSSNASQDFAWTIPEYSAIVASFKLGTSRPLRVFQRMIGLMSAASSVMPLGLLHMEPLYWLKIHILSHAWRLGWCYVRVIHHCIRAVAPWTTPHLFQSGIQLGLTSRRKVVTTDISSLGTLFEGNPAFGFWSSQEQHLHISCLEMMAVFLALKTFLPALTGQHVLVQLDIMTVVAFINHEGGLRSCPVYKMTPHLLFWAQNRLLSLWAVHVPGRLSDMLREWTCCPEAI